MTCPCKECNRKGCGNEHDSCEPYKAWAAERAEANSRRRMDTDNRQISREQMRKHWQNLKNGRTVSRR